MKLELRVQSHHFQAPEQTQIQLAAVQGQASFNATIPSTEAAQFPVGSTVDVVLTAR